MSFETDFRMSGQLPAGYMDGRDKYMVYLEISSWVGISGGAIHVYGTLKGCVNGKDVSIELERAIGKAEAEFLNEKDYGKDAKLGMWEEGDTTIRFNTVRELCNYAKKVFKEKFPHGKILIEGRSSYLDPAKVLVAPAELKRQANNIYMACEKCGRWEGDEKTMEKLSNKWEALLLKWFKKFDKHLDK